MQRLSRQIFRLFSNETNNASQLLPSISGTVQGKPLGSPNTSTTALPFPTGSNSVSSTSSDKSASSNTVQEPPLILGAAATAVPGSTPLPQSNTLSTPPTNPTTPVYSPVITPSSSSLQAAAAVPPISPLMASLPLDAASMAPPAQQTTAPPIFQLQVQSSDASSNTEVKDISLPDWSQTFQTHEFYAQLQEKSPSLSEEQCIAVTQTLARMLETTLQVIREQSVNRIEYEKHMHAHELQFRQLRSDIHRQQQHDLQTWKTPQDNLYRDLHSHRQQTRDQLSALRSESRLDLSLEKGRLRDAHLALHVKLQDWVSRVDTETGVGLASLGKLRGEIFYSLSGFVGTCTALLFGYLRYFSSK